MKTAIILKKGTKGRETKRERKRQQKKVTYQALENTSAAALGSFTTALEKTKTTIAASGRALLKLLSRHKLLVSDQALYLLQCKLPLLWS